MIAQHLPASPPQEAFLRQYASFTLLFPHPTHAQPAALVQMEGFETKISRAARWSCLVCSPLGNQISVTSQPRGLTVPGQLSHSVSQRTRGQREQHMSAGGLPLHSDILRLSPTVRPGSQGRVT